MPSPLERKLNQLQTLIEMTAVINSALDTREIERRAIEAATSLLEAEAGSLLLLDAESGDLYFDAAVGEKEGEVAKVRIDGGQGIAGWVLKTGEPLLVADAQGDPRFFRGVDAASGFVTRNMICVPVRSKEKTLGVLEAINRRDGTFAADDLAILYALANQVGVAIENASLYAQATTDGLTGLHHHKYFELRLKEEMQRAVRYRYPLSLLVTDIDFFKKVNDNHGHVAGDEVLKGFAAMLAKNTRDTDIIARYGGEEFAAVLPHTPVERAVQVAERLRSEVERTPFAGIAITVSIGAGEYCHETMRGDDREFVRKVDEALYRAKHNGRNRTERAT